MKLLSDMVKKNKTPLDLLPLENAEVVQVMTEYDMKLLEVWQIVSLKSVQCEIKPG